MSRFRFTGLIVYFAAVAALAPVVLTGCDHPSQFAADAHADTLPAAQPAPAQLSADRQFSTLPSLAPIVKQLRPTVVNVASRFKPRRIARNQRPPQGRQQRPNPFDNPGDDDDNGQGQEDPMERFFRFFGGGPQGQGPDQQERHGLGSGFLIGDGYVLTNNHVVEIQDPGSNKFRPMDDIKVSTDETAPGGSREFTAKVVGNDPKSDVALLKIEGEHVAELPHATLGDSDALQVGDYVIAIGEPFGLQATVTAGIISAKERALGPGSVYSDYLQTDASINPGNSGGPLFNLRGEVIGINSAIISGANTIGFAIPIAVVKQILPQLRQKGRVVRGFMGVQPQAITADMVDQLGLKSTRGALIAEVVPKGPASESGLKPGDVVVGLNGKPVNDPNQFQRDVGSVQPGQVAKVDVMRDGKTRTFEVKLKERPEDNDLNERSPAPGNAESAPGDPLGLRVQNLTPDLAQRARVEEGTKGVVVTDVAPDSPAATAELEPGDVIVEVNRQEVGSVDQYKKAIGRSKKGGTILLRVKRGPSSSYVPVKLKS
ncbi:MAG: Do family serine endopeptidase [Deltaproteobacteria bacterium]|nr:MAG: Do family serine endopeptidase [Deltaproteobacteria bacterium]TMB39944.1 MAG: Do family serine endopeptidase [Deltaproteobacteria bacterium]